MYTCYQCGGKGKHYWKYSNGEYFMSDDTKHKLTCNVCEGLGQIIGWKIYFIIKSGLVVMDQK